MNERAKNIAAFFPNNLQVFDVKGIDENDTCNSFLHKKFYEPLTLEDWHELAKQIAGFLYHSEVDAVYSFFKRSFAPDANTYEWGLCTAKLSRTHGNLADELVLFTYDLQLMGEGKRKIYRVLENELFFAAHFTQASSLTKRELTVIEMICAGMTSRQIADKLYISVNTVKTHRKKIHQKLATDNLATLMKYAEVFDLFEVI